MREILPIEDVDPQCPAATYRPRQPPPPLYFEALNPTPASVIPLP